MKAFGYISLVIIKTVCRKVSSESIEYYHRAAFLLCFGINVIRQHLAQAFGTVLRMNNKIVNFDIFPGPKFKPCPKSGNGNTEFIFKNRYLLVIMRDHFLKVSLILFDSKCGI